MLILVNTALGAGMLNYPYAYDQIGGILAAAFIQIILLIFILATMFILVYCADFNEDDTYHDVLLSMCGKRAQQISAVSIMLTCYGICVTFLVIIGDQYDRLFNSLLEDPTLWYLDRKFTIFITSILFIWPMCYAQRLDFLRHASGLGMFAMLYVAFLTVYEHYVLDEPTIASLLEKAEHQHYHSNHPKTSDYNTYNSNFTFETLHKATGSSSPQAEATIDKSFQWLNSLVVVPILCFAYQTHEVIVPVYACMKQRSLSKFMKESICALVVLYFLYNLVGAYGYSTFGSRVGPDIMSLYDAQDPIVVIGIIALVVKFVTTYPPLMFCGRGALDGLYGELRGLTSEESKAGSAQRRFIITTIWFFTTVLLAVFAPDISLTLQLLGSMAAVNVFVFPGICLMSLTRRLRKRRQYMLLEQENDLNHNEAKDYFVISGSYFGRARKNSTAAAAKQALLTNSNNRTCSATFASLIEYDNLIANPKPAFYGDHAYHLNSDSSNIHRHAQRLTCYGTSMKSNQSGTLLTDGAPSAGIDKKTGVLLYSFAVLLIGIGIFMFILELVTVTGIM